MQCTITCGSCVISLGYLALAQIGNTFSTNQEITQPRFQASHPLDFSLWSAESMADERKVRATQHQLTEYAKCGLRTLCMARRVIPLPDYKHWVSQHLRAENALQNREELLMESASAIECDLELIGASGIEDRLQDGVPDTIRSLRLAGIDVWVLTGDKQVKQKGKCSIIPLIFISIFYLISRKLLWILLTHASWFHPIRTSLSSMQTIKWALLAFMLLVT